MRKAFFPAMSTQDIITVFHDVLLVRKLGRDRLVSKSRQYSLGTKIQNEVSLWNRKPASGDCWKTPLRSSAEESYSFSYGEFFKPDFSPLQHRDLMIT